MLESRVRGYKFVPSPVVGPAGVWSCLSQDYGQTMLEEKMQIAKQYLIPDAISNSGTRLSPATISDEALEDLIRFYCRENGNI